MSENNFNPTVDENITKEKDLLMETNVNNVENGDNEASGTNKNEDIIEDKEKLVDINVNEIQGIESKPENIEANNEVGNNVAVEKVNEEDNREGGSTFEKEVDKVPDEAKFDLLENKNASESDQVLQDKSELPCDTDSEIKVNEEIANKPTNEELLINLESSQSEEPASIEEEKSHENHNDKSAELTNDLPDRNVKNDAVEENCSVDNQEMAQNVGDENLLNLTNEAVEEETLLIRGLPSNEDLDEMKSDTKSSDKDLFTSSDPTSSANDELSAITSTPSFATQHKILKDPFEESPAKNEEEQLINLEFSSQGQNLSTTEDDKSLKTGPEEPSSIRQEELLLSDPQESQLIKAEDPSPSLDSEPLTSEIQELASQQSEELLVTTSEDKSSDPTQEPPETIISNVDQFDSSEKLISNISQGEPEPSDSNDDQKLFEENQINDHLNVDKISSDDQNVSQKDTSCEISAKEVDNDSLKQGNQANVEIEIKEMNDPQHVNQEVSEQSSVINEQNEHLDKRTLSFEEQSVEDSNSQMDYQNEEKLTPQESMPCSIEEALSSETVEKDDFEPIVEEFSKSNLQLEESVPQSDSNQGNNFVMEDNQIVSSTQKEVLDNLQNQEKSQYYEDLESEGKSKDILNSLEKVDQNFDDSIQARLIDSGKGEEDVEISENLREYTEEVATNILRSSQDEIAKKSTTKSFWSREYQEFLKKNLSSLPAILFFSFIFISGVLGSAFEMNVIPFALLNVVAFLSIFIIYKCFLSC